MRIIIDARMMGPRWTGIGLYTRKLVEQLSLIDHNNQYLVLVDRDNFASWKPGTPNVKKVLAPYKIYGFAEQLLLPWKLWRLNADIVHFLHNVPILYRRRRVVMVHDTTMIDYDLAPAGFLKAIKYKVKRIGMRVAFRAIRSADMIIVPSNATKERLLALLKGISPEHIRVIYEAPEIELSKPTRRPIETTSPTLLYVGTLFPYKNLGVVLQAMALLTRSHPKLHLRVIGSTPRFNLGVKKEVEHLNLSKSVELTGFVSESEKNQAYRDATLFVFPSLSEGFGLPPLEAMSQGLPVLAATASALPEILGEGADYFDPHDPKDLAAKIETLLAHPKRLVDLQTRGFKRLGQFSWQKMATETLAVYEAVVKPAK